MQLFAQLAKLLVSPEQSRNSFHMLQLYIKCCLYTLIVVTVTVHERGIKYSCELAEELETGEGGIGSAEVVDGMDCLRQVDYHAPVYLDHSQKQMEKMLELFLAELRNASGVHRSKFSRIWVFILRLVIELYTVSEELDS